MSNAQRGTSTRPVAILIATQMRTQGGGKPPGAPDVGKALNKAMNSSPVAKSAFSKNSAQVGQAKQHLQSLVGKSGGSPLSMLKHGAGAVDALKSVTKSMATSPDRKVEIKSNVKLGEKAQGHADAIRDTMSQKKPNLLSALGHGMKLANELKRNPSQPLSEMPKHTGGKTDGGSGDDRFRISSNVKLEGKAQDHADAMRSAMSQKKPDLMSALKHGVKLAQELKRNPPQPLSEMPKPQPQGSGGRDDDRFRIVSSHALEGEAKTHADALRDAMSQKRPDLKTVLAHGVKLAQSIKQSRASLSPMEGGHAQGTMSSKDRAPGGGAGGRGVSPMLLVLGRPTGQGKAFAKLLSPLSIGHGDGSSEEGD